MLFWKLYFCNFIAMIALQAEYETNTFTSSAIEQHLITGKT